MAASQLVNTDSIGDFTDVQPEKLRVRGNPPRDLLASGPGFSRPGTPNSASPRSLIEHSINFCLALKANTDGPCNLRGGGGGGRGKKERDRGSNSGSK